VNRTSPGPKQEWL